MNLSTTEPATNTWYLIYAIYLRVVLNKVDFDIYPFTASSFLALELLKLLVKYNKTSRASKKNENRCKKHF